MFSLYLHPELRISQTLIRLLIKQKLQNAQILFHSRAPIAYPKTPSSG